MRILALNLPPFQLQPIINQTIMHKFAKTELSIPNFRFRGHRRIGRPRTFSCSSSQNDGVEGSLQELKVPRHWLEPSKAAEESEWLRATLHKWLDDEYCPEPTNVEISKVAASSFYKSMVEKRTDIGEILLTMAKELESISYQESFHGAFSSANAAVDLIVQRILQE